MTRVGPAVLLPALLIALGSAGAARADEDVAEAARQLLAAQRDAWNRGDIDGFMQGYWKDDALRLASGDTVRQGWAATLAHYRAVYPDAAAMGRLAFDLVEVRPLGPDAASVFGRWNLERGSDAPDRRPHGLFTLLVERKDGTWVVTRDHTSAAAIASPAPIAAPSPPATSAPARTLAIDASDVVKLTVPFVTAILMVWIKSWIEGARSRASKRRALARLLHDQLSSMVATLDVFERIADTAKQGKMRLITLETSEFVPKLCADLADLDPGNAYRYARLAASQRIVEKGLARLSASQAARASASTDEVGERLDRIVFGQARITGRDTVQMGVDALAVLDAIPVRERDGIDDAQVASLEAEREKAQQQIAGWS